MEKQSGYINAKWRSQIKIENSKKKIVLWKLIIIVSTFVRISTRQKVECKIQNY